MVAIKRAAAAFLSLALLFTCLSGCSDNKTVSIKMPADVSENDADWSQNESGFVTLRNECVEFVLDCSTTHFTVKDLRNSKSYSTY